LYLKQRIAGIKETVSDTHLSNLFNSTFPEYPDDENANEEDSSPHTSKTYIYYEINEIYKRCLQESYNLDNADDDRLNAQFCPPLAIKFLEFSELLPVWSGIMVPIFGYGDATHLSNASESLFKELKKDIFGNKSLPLRLDDFLKLHVETTTG